jgi:DNA polymerase-1
MSAEGEKRILLIDGNSIINRAFFALSGRSNLTAPDGTPTGAVNTFLNTIFKHIEDIRPTHVAALFDRREKTFRHEMFDGYKAKRKGMPDELAVQVPLLKDILDAMGISRYELPGYEADDLIGTYTEQAEDKGIKVFILSGDKDDFQLISSDTVVVMPVSKAGKTASDIYDTDLFFERYGLLPSEFVTVKALMGDPSDNIPGVRGVGEKTALELVRKHKNLDDIYENLSEFPDGLRNKLEENREMAYLSYELSRIKRDVPVEPSIEEFVVTEPDKDKLADLLYRYGLRSQLKKAGLENHVPYEAVTDSPSGESDDTSAAKLIPATLSEIAEVTDISSFEGAIKSLLNNGQKRKIVAIDVFTDSRGSVEIPERRLLVSFSPTEIVSVDAENITPALEALAQAGFGLNKDRIVAGFSIKETYKFLPGPLPFDRCFDTEIAGYLLNQIEGASPSFETLFEHALGIPYPRLPEDESSVMDRPGKSQATLLESMLLPVAKDSIDLKTDRTYLLFAWRVMLIHSLVTMQTEQIISSGIEKLAFEIEMPLVLHLDRMERAGFLVDRDFLTSMHEDFERKLGELTMKIYDDAGMTFNILSPKQLGQVLFEHLGLPSGRKNAGGTYSTDSDELMRLSDHHPVVSSILEYRQISKLDSTFIVGLLRGIDPADGRIHSSFSQAMTSTGRLSSAEPNLQNIPIRTELGRLIRKAFIAPDGYILLDADYSQIELRLLAHLSQDENMLNAFLNNEDIHTNTAASIFKVPKEMVLPHMRSAAKTVNFSIVYGISDFGLSQDLGVSFQEAHTYIEKYYARYPQIRAYLDSLKATGYEKGYVETLFGRKRVLRELTSPNRNVRMFGERAAMNTPIQGTAADIIKIAMNKVSDDLRLAKLDARLILQVHDELIIECSENDVSAASVILKNAMENAAVLTVPLVSDVRVGKSWYQCKE